MFFFEVSHSKAIRNLCLTVTITLVTFITISIFITATIIVITIRVEFIQMDSLLVIFIFTFQSPLKSIKN